MDVYEVRVVFSPELNQEDYANLLVGDMGFTYHDLKIDILDIDYIDISMCSCPAGEDLHYHVMLLNYYVDLIIETIDKRKVCFQIINDSAIEDIFRWLKNKKINYQDKINIEEIFSCYKDTLTRYNFIRRNFRIWAQKFNLDNPRKFNNRKY